MTVRPKILCIEDDPATVELLVEVLTDEGFDAIVAFSGAEGVRKFSERPNVILCDVDMPQMSGFAVLQELRKSASQLRNVPFLFITAYGSRETHLQGRGLRYEQFPASGSRTRRHAFTHDRSRRLGCDDFLTKPTDFELLVEIVRSRLAQSPKTQPIDFALTDREIEALTWVAQGKIFQRYCRPYERERTDGQFSCQQCHTQARRRHESSGGNPLRTSGTDRYLTSRTTDTGYSCLSPFRAAEASRRAGPCRLKVRRGRVRAKSIANLYLLRYGLAEGAADRNSRRRLRRCIGITRRCDAKCRRCLFSRPIDVVMDSEVEIHGCRMNDTKAQSLPHAIPVETAIAALNATAKGLSQMEADLRLRQFGPNRLPEAPPAVPSLRFLAHFHNVLIYVLLGAAVIMQDLDTSSTPGLSSQL